MNKVDEFCINELFFDKHERYDGNFNSFPMLSFDGKLLAWESDRNVKQPKYINVFIADWVA
jgi:hypothetical protein